MLRVRLSIGYIKVKIMFVIFFLNGKLYLVWKIDLKIWVVEK